MQRGCTLWEFEIMRHKMLKSLILYAKFEIIHIHEIKNNKSGETACANCVLVASSTPSTPSERDFFFLILSVV